MNSYKRWTEEEEKVILSQIQENPGNLTEAFRKAGETLGRTFTAVHYHWYRVMAPKNLNNRANTVFMTYSAGKVNCNRKITRPETQRPWSTRRSKWRRILDILFK